MHLLLEALLLIQLSRHTPEEMLTHKALVRFSYAYTVLFAVFILSASCRTAPTLKSSQYRLQSLNPTCDHDQLLMKSLLPQNSPRCPQVLLCMSLKQLGLPLILASVTQKLGTSFSSGSSRALLLPPRDACNTNTVPLTAGSFLWRGQHHILSTTCACLEEIFGMPFLRGCVCVTTKFPQYRCIQKAAATAT